jgi:hypothetical protein
MLPGSEWTDRAGAQVRALEESNWKLLVGLTLLRGARIY